MPYRPLNDGSYVATRMTNRPRRGVAPCPPGEGCGVAPGSEGAGEREARYAARVASPPPGAAVSRAARGWDDRAARYAVQVSRRRARARGGLG